METKKFKTGEIIEFKGAPNFAALTGALAIITNTTNHSDYIFVKWLPVTKHLTQGQMDGLYKTTFFDTQNATN